MTFPLRKPALLALGLMLSVPLGACGFSDTLTARGFVKEGDQICVDTLVRTRIGLRSQGETTPTDFLSALASSYDRAAAGFRGLDIRSDDEAMRDRVVAGYSSFADDLGSASRAAASGSGSTRAQAEAVFSEIAAQQRRMKDYGFDVCGGGGAAPGGSPS